MGSRWDLDPKAPHGPAFKEAVGWVEWWSDNWVFSLLPRPAGSEASPSVTGKTGVTVVLRERDTVQGLEVMGEF